MRKSDTALHDEEVFSDELPDAVLEVVGSKSWQGPASSVTIGFCSGPESAGANNFARRSGEYRQAAGVSAYRGKPQLFQ